MARQAKWWMALRMARFQAAMRRWVRPATRRHGSACQWLVACLAWVVSLAFLAAAPAAHAAHRVITLAPHATEIVHASGGGDFLTGTVSSSDFPASARELPRVGDGILLNQERIIMLRPTLLVGWLRSGVALQMEALATQLGADMIYSRPLTLRDIPAEVRRIGQLLGTSATAEPAANALEARINALETRYAGRTPVKVFVEVGHKPLYTIGADPLLNDALRVCGAVNVYADTGIPAPRTPVESVLVQNPQLILAAGHATTDAQAVQERWRAHGLPAARQGHVHLADPDALFRPGPRLIDATEALCPAVDSARNS